ncbi:MAG: hypothetical protein AAF434_17305 [Pseudomonadota bacterium]
MPLEQSALIGGDLSCTYFDTEGRAKSEDDGEPFGGQLKGIDKALDDFLRGTGEFSSHD